MSDTPETLDPVEPEAPAAEAAEPEAPHKEHWTETVERHLAEDFGAAIRVLVARIHELEAKLAG